LKIQLEYPYNRDWKLGYLRVSTDGRRRVDLVNKNSDRTTTSYARYLVSVVNGRYLTPEEEVDHIDNDCTNDDIVNLQVLTIEQHKEKTRLHCEGRTMANCTCAYCGKVFERELRNVRSDRTLCSRSCNARYNMKFLSWGNKKDVPDETLDMISAYRKSGLSDYKISALIGIERSKVWRLRKEYSIE